jgi:3-oxoacyl-[acyl-carrier protein] reductase
MTLPTVLITGAGIGIGRATAQAFGRTGYRVIVTDILEAEGQDVADGIRKAGGDAAFYRLDVTNTQSVNDLLTTLEKRYGALDVLVNNAGIAYRLPLATMTDEEWDHTLDVDLKGMMRNARAASPAMRKRGGGAIVCISSVAGTIYGWNEHAAYSAAKGGVAGLVRALAAELAGDGIRVNGIAPGIIRSAQSLSEEHSLGEAGLEAIRPRVPLKRIGEPDDIAPVVVFLASDAARYVTGQVITVDGGLNIAF